MYMYLHICSIYVYVYIYIYMDIDIHRHKSPSLNMVVDGLKLMGSINMKKLSLLKKKDFA